MVPPLPAWIISGSSWPPPPRAFEPEVHSALIREKHPLSAAHLAARLELGVELVQEQLTAMESEGILVRTPPSGGLLEKAEQEALYRLGAAGAAPPSAASPRRAQGPIVSRAGRDALYQDLLATFTEVEDLERLAESEDPQDLEECEEIGARVLNALRLIQEGGIGWGKSGNAEFLELSMPPAELAELVTQCHRKLFQFVERERASWEESKSEFDGFVNARDACGAILDQLRPALAGP